VHIALGKSLRGLMGDNILVIGSGFSFHNIGAFFGQDSGAPDPANEAFQDWLVETCTSPALDQSQREQRLIKWEKAPSARYCHPREEHLLPLHVCLGMAGAPGKLVFNDRIMGKRGVAFLWQ
jgi:aromatic ring-opening dioxygenase catalytic subunit (LigB family)